MAPIRNTSLRVHAFGKIDTMLALTPDEIQRLIEAPQSEERQEIQDDPCLSYLMDQYVEAERSRFQNSNAGPTLEALREYHVRIEARVYAQEIIVQRREFSAEARIKRVMLKDLSFETVAKKFGMPIMEAAKQLRIHKSTLQIWCRMNGISRWPYMKIHSIETLLKNVQEFGSDKMFGDEGIAGIVEKLEKEKRAIMERPNLAIEDNTKSLMKYMKHVSWKKRKLNEDTK